MEPPTLLRHREGPGQLLPSAVTSVLGWGRDGDPGAAAVGWGPLVGAVSPLAPVLEASGELWYNKTSAPATGPCSGVSTALPRPMGLIPTP